ncbi:PepSY domain-containing protein [Parasedimentitalea marina]|uniref:PepSY domain-containing protein n=1 Tax=Parasedimentitalea marina TaxID=2483033 RepID=A0A3T0N768_9RHOB|nr:PepSY domain-containing protein [Parasedimentitalea marina]AZV79821.1 PepSY domain-containing protein [Parasedimentitalea marina]
MENLKTLTLVTLLIGAPALAMANITVGDSLSTDEAEIRTMVEAQGYTVQDIEVEDGEFEVEVLLDGVESELVIDMTTGMVTEIETD